MRILSFVTLLCFSLLLAATSAQEPSVDPTPEQLQQRLLEFQLRYIQSPRRQLDEKAREISNISSIWNGQGTWMSLPMIEGIGGLDELRLTEEQKLRLSFFIKESEPEWFERMRQNPTPEFTQAEQALRAARLPDDPHLERATEEQKDAYWEAVIFITSLRLAEKQTGVQDTLTPEQMLQIRKFEMLLMTEGGIPFSSMFEPLDLTEDQKMEMCIIIDEMKTEFDRLTKEAATLKGEQFASLGRLIQGKPISSSEELMASLHEAARRNLPSEAMRRRAEELREQGTQFVTLLQNRLMNVLTDEQLDRMQQILDEMPETVKQTLAQMRAGREAQRQSPGYIPGPDSWQPSDPLPVRLRERTRGNFPRPAN